MANEIQLKQPRLPYHPAVEEKFGVDKSGWKALVEAVFPAAQEPDSVILALSYCKSRGLDPFKKCVHIVPVWNSKLKRMVDTVWPGIGELRTTAFRTKNYAGRDATKFGPKITKQWPTERGDVTVTYPEWAQVTVYRIVGNQRVAFAGPPVYWEETFASIKGGVPNSMWQKRPLGQLDKCAEAQALRCAFPEEIGDEFTADDGPMIVQHGYEGVGPKSFSDTQAETQEEIEETMGSKTAGPAPESEPTPEPTQEQEAEFEPEPEPQPESDENWML